MPPFPICSTFSFHPALITTSILYLLALQRQGILILQMGGKVPCEEAAEGEM